MPAVQWALHNDAPLVEVLLGLEVGQREARRLIADTGAGTRSSPFELVLANHDCVRSGALPFGTVQLGGAYSGRFPLYLFGVDIPAVSFSAIVPVVGVPSVPPGFDGIAGFRFLNRFTYGNFGSRTHFGLDPLPAPSGERSITTA